MIEDYKKLDCACLLPDCDNSVLLRWVGRHLFLKVDPGGVIIVPDEFIAILQDFKSKGGDDKCQKKD